MNNDGARPTSPAVAVNNLGVVMAGNRFMTIFDRTSPIGLLETRGVDASDFPYRLAGAGNTRFQDARAYHDPIHNRLWTAYVEGEFDDSRSLYCADQAYLHVANTVATADFSLPNPLFQWHYTTGPVGSFPPGPAYDLRLGGYAKYQPDADHKPIEKTARMPSMGFLTPSGMADDREGGIIVALNARTTESCILFSDDGPNGPPSISGMFQYIYIIPYEHSGGLESILDGSRVPENLITVINTSILDDSVFQDKSIYGCVVQAPYEQPTNAALIISTPEEEMLGQDIRLKGVFYNSLAPAGQKWTLQQRTTSPPTPILDDIDLDSTFHYRATNATGANPFPAKIPETPDPWGPAAQGTYFHSAVLAKDVNGDMRVFAVHAVLPSDTSDDRWVVQWYVIDPDLPAFQSTLPGSWEPDIAQYNEMKAVGRLEGEGDSYHPVIVVNRQGQAFIEYTYSDSTTWPQVRRVRLNSGYNAIVGSPTLVEAGPPQPYDEYLVAPIILGSWANVADAQADPFNPCAYWSTHTLVDELVNNVPDPSSDKRDVWLFYQAYGNTVEPNCFQTANMLDLNDDNEVDSYDMLEFGPMFDRRARRVDVDGNGVVDATDAALFTDAYRGYTASR